MARSPGRPPDHPLTSDARIYTAAEMEFIRAMDAHVRRSGRKIPPWSDCLAVAVALGYRKAAAPEAKGEQG